MDYERKKGFRGKPQKDSHRFPVTKVNELMLFLLEKMPHKNRNNIKTLLRDKHVLVDGQVQSQFNFPLAPGQVVEINPDKGSKTTSYTGFKIVHEDQDLMVVDKQAGVLTIATDKEKDRTVYSQLSSHIKKQNPRNKIFIVHRLDRETSGLVVFAKNENAKNILQKSWNDMVIERTYVALVEGLIETETGTVTSWLKENKAFVVYSTDNPEGAQKAVTHYQVIRKGKKFSLLKINLETGRKNQIRVHMKDIGHPVVGDKKYGSTLNPIGRIGLHAQVLAFIHPVNKKELRFESPVPAKFLSEL